MLGLLGCWDYCCVGTIGVLGLLGCWTIGVLDYWGVGLWGCWTMRVSDQWAVGIHLMGCPTKQNHFKFKLLFF